MFNTVFVKLSDSTKKLNKKGLKFFLAFEYNRNTRFSKPGTPKHQVIHFIIKLTELYKNIFLNLQMARSVRG
jgi:hypothetical protein